MANLPKELLYFSSVHTSKGVYRQVKLDVNSFLESGERVTPPASQATTTTNKDDTTQTNQNHSEADNPTQPKDDSSVCTKSNSPDFANKLKEALSFLKQGLPAGTVMKVMIPYAINLIKPAEGKEDIWFECTSFDGSALQVSLKQTPQLVKYLKQGSSIKPALEKIEQFAFEG